MKNEPKSTRSVFYTAYVDTCDQFLPTVPDVLYHIEQTEVCPTTGRLHYQGAIHFNRAYTWPAIHARLPRYHVESVKSWKDTIDYCSSKGKHVNKPHVAGTQRTFGTPPAQGQRTDWDTLRQHLVTGDLRSIDLQYHVRYPRGIMHSLDIFYEPERSRDIRVIVLWGPSGTGKTRTAYDLTDGKTWWRMEAKHQWYNGYLNHEVAIIDDFDPRDSGISLRVFLQITDRYEVRAPTKGGFANFKPKLLIFTSNIHPCDWWPSENDKVLRRIHQITHLESLQEVAAVTK